MCVRARCCLFFVLRKTCSVPAPFQPRVPRSQQELCEKEKQRSQSWVKKNNNQNQRLFSSMQALPVAIYTLLRGYLCPLPSAGWGIFLDLMFLVGYSPAVQGRVRLMPGLWSLRCLALMVV